MRQRNQREKRDILRLLAAFGPVLLPIAGLALPVSGCSRGAPGTVQVPMISSTDAVFDPLDATGGRLADGGDGARGKDGGVVELEPSPPADAFACRRDVACRAPAAPTAPTTPLATSGAPAPASKRATGASGTSGTSGSSLPAPFDRCSLQDDQGRHFSARETRDARLIDVARCCYVSFVGCVRGSSR